MWVNSQHVRYNYKIKKFFNFHVNKIFLYTYVKMKLIFIFEKILITNNYKLNNKH